MKLFVSYHYNKFINNIILSKINNLEILSGQYQGHLYKIQQEHSVNAYIFNTEDLCDHEVLQFIEDYSKKLKILIYHVSDDSQIVSEFSQCQHLIHQKENMLDDQHTIIIPSLVNTSIFTNSQMKKNDNDSIISFIDNISELPESLLSVLYPKTKLKIKMYGGMFRHHQNLGSISEYDKCDLLNMHKLYLDINGEYAKEAVLRGCDVITLDTIFTKTAINDSIDMQYKSYTQFLHEILI